MSDEKNKVTDKASEIAKNIWLAGVGAYGKAVEDAQGRLEKAMEPPKLFKDLVKAGTALEEDARDAARETTATARHSVEERIHRVRENFQMQKPARMEDIATLQKKVEQLTRKVDKLNKALAEQGIVPAPRKKKAPAKKTAGKKAPAKRAAAKKSGAAATRKTRKAASKTGTPKSKA